MCASFQPGNDTASRAVSAQARQRQTNPHRVRRSLGEDGSLEVVTAKCEPALEKASPESRYQFERLG